MNLSTRAALAGVTTAADFSVIICAYTEERWQDLSDAIESVQSQSLPPREIIVAVDHNPLLAERLRSKTDWSKRVPLTIVENSQPRGLSGARNSGIAVAQGAIIAFLDDDAAADRQWLACLSESYASPQVLGVGGKINPNWLAGRPGWFPEEFDWVTGCTYLGVPLTKRPVRNLIGCNMSFRRELFDGVGGFRNGIGRVGKRPVGCEETELCIRASQKWPEVKFIYNPQAVVQHRVPANRATWDYFRARCYAEGLSKALVTQLVGATSGLDTERGYVLKTLPVGVARGVFASIRQRSIYGLGRSGAIIAGLFLTTLGYIKGNLYKSMSVDPPPEIQLQNLNTIFEQVG